MAAKFFLSRLAVVAVSGALVGVLTQPPGLRMSYAAPQTIAPRACGLPPIAGINRQTPPDPDWTIDRQIDRRRYQPDSTKPKDPKVRVIEQSVTSVAFSPDGRTLASGSQYTVIIGKEERLESGILTGRDVNGGVDIWQNLGRSDWRGGVLHNSLREINTVAFSPAGIPLLAAGGNDQGFVGLWGRNQWIRYPSAPQDSANTQIGIQTIAFSPNGRLLASGGTPSLGEGRPLIYRWNVQKGELTPIRSPLQLVGQPQRPNQYTSQIVYALAFSPDSKIIAVGGLSNVYDRRTIPADLVGSTAFLHLWEAQSGRYLCSLNNPESAEISAIAFSPDGTLLATGNTSGSVQLWSLPNTTLLRTFKHQGRVNGIAFSPSGQILLSGSRDRTAKLWKTATGALINQFKYTDEVTSVVFRPDGQAFATGSKDNRVHLFLISQ